VSDARPCPGSGLQPILRYVATGRGKCRVCGGWFALGPGERLGAHAYLAHQFHLSSRAAA
jgi:hypothetical protein